MKNWKVRLTVGLIAALCAFQVFAQAGPIRGEVSAGVYENIKTDGAGRMQVSTTATVALDPCQSSASLKSSVAINITTAATTVLVTMTAGQIIYVCAINMTISQVVTTPNTIQIKSATNGACTTGSPATYTGLIGDGGVTAAAPLMVNMNAGGAMLFSTSASPLHTNVCAFTAIGATASFQGTMTYVKQ